MTLPDDAPSKAVVQRFELSEQDRAAFVRAASAEGRRFAFSILLGGIAFGVLLVFCLEWGLTDQPRTFVLPGVVVGLVVGGPLAAYALWKSSRVSAERIVERLSGPLRAPPTAPPLFIRPETPRYMRTFHVGNEPVLASSAVHWIRDWPGRGFADRTARYRHLLAIVSDKGTVLFTRSWYDPLSTGPRPVYADTMAKT